MPARTPAPTDAELRPLLGDALAVWKGIIAALEKEWVPLGTQWKPCKAGLGRMCLLQHKQRTLLYLTPDRGAVWVAIVLGERAVALARASDLPEAIKRLIEEARPYAEGRGIRFLVHQMDEVGVVAQLVRIKTTPR